MRDQARFSSRVLSDGTLRILALLTLLHDPKRRGVLCFEEPENGIHEARVKGLIELLRDFCTDLNEPPQQGEKLSQILVNCHSPEVMSHLLPNEIVAADMVLVSDPFTQQTYRRSRMRSGVLDELPIDRRLDESRLTRFELGQLLRREVGQDS
jgi:predicted ATPase